MKIDDLEEDMYMNLQEKIAKDNDLKVEYGCVESDIVVIKILHTKFASKADNELMVKRKLRSSVAKKEIKVVFVEIHTESGDSKC